MKQNRQLMTLAFAAGITFAAAPGVARELRYAVGYPPGAAAVGAAKDMAALLDEATGGDLTIKVYTSALLGFGEMAGGVRDGIADVGYLVTPYFPQDFPRTNLLNDTSMKISTMGDEANAVAGMAYGGAMMEFIMLDCPECLQEYADQNMVFTGVGPTATYHLLCNTPLTTVAELDGKRLRAGAGQWNRWAVEMGATPVQITGQESLEAMKQGIIDCTVLSAVTALKDFQLINVATDVTIGVPGGVFAATPATTVNAGVWSDLTPENRRAFLNAAAYMAAAVPMIDHQGEADVLSEAAERGIATHAAADYLAKATADFVAADASNVTGLYAEQFGVTDAEDMIVRFEPILEKWVGMVQGVSTIEDLAEIYRNEIYSKVDEAEYGL